MPGLWPTSLVCSHLLLVLSWSTSNPRGARDRRGPRTFPCPLNIETVWLPQHQCRGWCPSQWTGEVQILTDSNPGCKTSPNFGTESVSAKLLPGKPSVSGFSPLEQEFLTTPFAAALLAAWALTSTWTRSHPAAMNLTCRHICWPHPRHNREKHTHRYPAAQTTTLQRCVLKAALSFLFSLLLFIILPFTFICVTGKHFLLLEQLDFIRCQDTAETQSPCPNSLAEQLLKPSDSREISCLFQHLGTEVSLRAISNIR